MGVLNDLTCGKHSEECMMHSKYYVSVCMMHSIILVFIKRIYDPSKYFINVCIEEYMIDTEKGPISYVCPHLFLVLPTPAMASATKLSLFLFF